MISKEEYVKNQVDLAQSYIDRGYNGRGEEIVSPSAYMRGTIKKASREYHALHSVQS